MLERTVVIVGAEELGKGSSELGSLLMKNFFLALLEKDNLPTTLIFINAGVKLLAGEKALEKELREFEKRNVELLGCGTCLDNYGIKDKV